MVGESKREDIRAPKTEEHKLKVFWRTRIASAAGYPPQLLPNGSHTRGASFAKWFFNRLDYHDVHIEPEDGPGREWLNRAHRFGFMLDDIWDREARDASGWMPFNEPYAFCRHLRLFRTDKGYLGLGTECLWPGDESSPGSHRLVGGTYLHRFMEGEGVSPSVTGLTADEIEASMEPFVLV
ncbi:hypothetical protein GE09DRAFT_1261428 [Coniochaeta sp. 2T2.1]|nr:hypothetical protein GE09DRAFT_1261428 [Coniochaeta sp. 2T2.1]